jgi:hypothetical protein
MNSISALPPFINRVPGTAIQAGLRLAKLENVACIPNNLIDVGVSKNSRQGGDLPGLRASRFRSERKHNRHSIISPDVRIYDETSMTWLGFGHDLRIDSSNHAR